MNLLNRNILDDEFTVEWQQEPLYRFQHLGEHQAQEA